MRPRTSSDASRGLHRACVLRGFNTTLDTMMCAITVLTCNFLRCILFAAQGNAEAVAGQVTRILWTKLTRARRAPMHVCMCVYVCVYVTLHHISNVCVSPFFTCNMQFDASRNVVS
jgi:hypothetical protein